MQRARWWLLSGCTRSVNFYENGINLVLCSLEHALCPDLYGEQCCCRVQIKKYRLLFLLVTVCAVAAAAGLILFSNVRKAKFEGDETRHVASAYYYTDLLLKGDFDFQRWEANHLGAFGSKLYLHLGQILLGLPLQYYSLRYGERFYTCRYHYDDSYKENKRNGFVPPQGILLTARRSVVVFGILSCIVAFFVGYHTGGIWVGVLTAVFLMINKVFIECATHAMTDMHYAFFLLCCSLLVVLFVGSARKKSLFLLSALCGVMAGLAGSVKLIGLGVIGLFFFFLLCYLYALGSVRFKGLLFFMLFFSLSALMIVYFFDPYLWDTYRPLKFPLLVRNWHNVNVAHGSLPVAIGSNRLPFILSALLSQWGVFPYATIFLFVGIVYSMVKLFCSVRTRVFDLRVIPLLFFFANYLFILIFVTINWSRYYLPTIAASQFLIAYGIYEIVRFFCKHCIGSADDIVKA